MFWVFCENTDLLIRKEGCRSTSPSEKREPRTSIVVKTGAEEVNFIWAGCLIGT